MATATKTTGYGNVPGYGKVGGTPKLNKTPKFGSPALQQAPAGLPSFNSLSPPAVAPQAAPQAGTAPQLSTGSSGGGVAADPRDPTYWTDVAKIKNTFDTTNQSYDLQESQGRTQLNTSLAALDRQQPIDTSNQKGTYNNSGLFYSSKLTGAETELTHKYDEDRTGARAGFGNLVDSLNILRRQNKNQYGTGPNGELTGTAYLDALNAGVGRSTEADTARANSNTLAGLNPDGSAPGAGGVTYSSDPTVNAAIQALVARPYNTATVPGGVLHIYPDGRKVLVKNK